MDYIFHGLPHQILFKDFLKWHMESIQLWDCFLRDLKSSLIEKRYNIPCFQKLVYSYIHVERKYLWTLIPHWDIFPQCHFMFLLSLGKDKKEVKKYLKVEC